MSVGDNHVALDRLTAIALVVRAPRDDATETAADRQALAHVARCHDCRAALARLTSQAAALRDAACQEADALFDDARLDVQRARILDRLTYLGKAARVLRFPPRTREATMPIRTGTHRWVSVAAAAGLIIGLVAGQLLHFVPWDPSADRNTNVLQAPPFPNGPVLVPASAAAAPTLTDDELLDEIEAAVQLRRATSLRALDALTPTASDFREISLGR